MIELVLLIRVIWYLVAFCCIFLPLHGQHMCDVVIGLLNLKKCEQVGYSWCYFGEVLSLLELWFFEFLMKCIITICIVANDARVVQKETKLVSSYC